VDDLSLSYAAPAAPPVLQAQQNPGQKGLRFLHFPSWHQPFLLGFVLLNQTTIWKRLSRSEQKALERAGRDALTESYQKSASAQCDKLREYGDEALQKLQEATDQYLQSLRGAAAPTPEQLEFRRVHESLLAYEKRVRFVWKPTAFPAACKLPGKAPVATH
jgi:TRAP-type mannitol/chloroaromatic compound transport system substrate-binding protein